MRIDQYEEYKWIEAINLTLAVPEDQGRLFDIIRQVKSSPQRQADNSTKVSLYRHTKRNDSWSILLQRESGQSNPRKTNLGKNFAHIASKFGVVEHAVWKKSSSTRAG